MQHAGAAPPSVGSSAPRVSTDEAGSGGDADESEQDEEHDQEEWTGQEKTDKPRAAGLKRKKPGSDGPAKRATPSRFYGVRQVTLFKNGTPVTHWRADYKDLSGYPRRIGNFADEETAAFAYNDTVTAAGLASQRKLNPVVDGKLVEKKGSYSNYYGVTWVPRISKWTSRIKVPNKKKKHLGYFDEEIEAAKAGDDYMYKYAPSFAAQKANFPKAARGGDVSRDPRGAPS
mmetsp:Transcript_35852/g.107903  ORF Transcript_35852/g.107903 Transcript_35852/m.107903 type:complete len:230 (+) Transcript_35852:1-690(+)